MRNESSDLVIAPEACGCSASIETADAKIIPTTNVAIDKAFWLIALLANLPFWLRRRSRARVAGPVECNHQWPRRAGNPRQAASPDDAPAPLPTLRFAPRVRCRTAESRARNA